MDRKSYAYALTQQHGIEQNEHVDEQRAEQNAPVLLQHATRPARPRLVRLWFLLYNINMIKSLISLFLLCFWLCYVLPLESVLVLMGVVSVTGGTGAASVDEVENRRIYCLVGANSDIFAFSGVITLLTLQMNIISLNNCRKKNLNMRKYVLNIYLIMAVLCFWLIHKFWLLAEIINDRWDSWRSWMLRERTELEQGDFATFPTAEHARVSMDVIRLNTKTNTFELCTLDVKTSSLNNWSDDQPGGKSLCLVFVYNFLQPCSHVPFAKVSYFRLIILIYANTYQILGNFASSRPIAVQRAAGPRYSTALKVPEVTNENYFDTILNSPKPVLLVVYKA